MLNGLLHDFIILQAKMRNYHFFINTLRNLVTTLKVLSEGLSEPKLCIGQDRVYSNLFEYVPSRGFLGSFLEFNREFKSKSI